MTLPPTIGLGGLSQIEQKNGPKQKLVGLELKDKGIARNGYNILDSKDVEIGKITSGSMSPTLNKAIAMGYISSEMSDIGNEVFVQIRNKKIRSVIISLPFVK